MSATDALSNYDWSTSTVAQRNAQKKADVNSGKVSHDDFLLLLTKQLTTQDPLNPMEDIDFLGQLAQLQALDEQMAMTKSMSAMRTDTQFQAGTSMIGKFVSGYDAYGNEAAGMVSRVVQKDGEVLVELQNKQRIPIGNVENVWNQASSLNDQLAAAGNLIGMFVDAGVDPETKQPVQGIIEKVVVENGAVNLKLYGGKTVALDSVRSLRAPTDEDIWYSLPDNMREQVEKASGYVHQYVTGTTADGTSVEGIAISARLSGDKVIVTLFDGTQIPVSNVLAHSAPSLSERANSITVGQTYVSGADTSGNAASGVVVSMESDGDNLILTLADGKKMMFTDVTAARAATADEIADLPAADPDPEPEEEP